MTAHENSCLPGSFPEHCHPPRDRNYLTLILFGVRGCSRAQQGDAQHVAAARETILRFRQDGDAVPVLAEIRVLITVTLIGSPPLP